MFLHLGGDTSILCQDIIGLFDIETAKRGIATAEFLEVAESEKRTVQAVAKDKQKSFVLVGDQVYFSPISSVTLQKRALVLKASLEEE